MKDFNTCSKFLRADVAKTRFFVKTCNFDGKKNISRTRIAFTVYKDKLIAITLVTYKAITLVTYKLDFSTFVRKNFPHLELNISLTRLIESNHLFSYFC